MYRSTSAPAIPINAVTPSATMPLDHMPVDARPREKLLTRGTAALSDTELLAILLRTGIPGKDVLQLADELLRTPHQVAENGAQAQGFGGIAGLLHTNPKALAQVKGLGPAKCAQILAVLELARRAMAQRLQERAVLDSPQAARQFFQLHLSALPHEVFAVMFLDVQNRMLAMEEMFKGTISQASVYPREVVIRALHHQASAVVLAHNHPSGSVQPSRADEALTQTLKAALALIDVRVLDHIIVAQGLSFSMAEQGLV